jgi:hypothetical protein
MKESLEVILTSRLSKENMKTFINNNPEEFKKAIDLSVSDDQNLGWRAAWMVQSVMEKNDTRIMKNIRKLIRAIENKRDGHQRELLKIIRKINVNDNDEGYLLDQCVLIWSNINKSSSVRITAFTIIADLVKKYPELINEVEPLSEKHYYQNLSAGIKHSFFKIKQDMFRSVYNEK